MRAFSSDSSRRCKRAWTEPLLSRERRVKAARREATAVVPAGLPVDDGAESWDGRALAVGTGADAPPVRRTRPSNDSTMRLSPKPAGMRKGDVATDAMAVVPAPASVLPPLPVSRLTACEAVLPSPALVAVLATSVLVALAMPVAGRVVVAVAGAVAVGALV